MRNQTLTGKTLTGNWNFRQVGSGEWLPAQVPGCAHTDLLAQGKIPDPFVADNEKQVMWVAETDWEYQTSFTPDAGLLAEEKVYLTADGLDTLAEVRLNGDLLGHTENMFRVYSWEVKELLKAGPNELKVTFQAPVDYIRQEQAKRPLSGVSQAIEGAPHIRKAPCQFGWDWGPMLPPTGIWKDIRLEGCSVAHLDDVHLRQVHENDQVTISVDLSVESFVDQPLNAKVSVTSPQGQVLEAGAPIFEETAALQVPVEDPQLWWPNGYGEQPLYEVAVSLESEGGVCDQRIFKFGLRTIELRQVEDEWGRSFTFVVNGVPIFAKGSNWIPADSFPTRLSDEHMDKLIRDAAASNQNMLRVWGGGFYEEERFYDLCDAYGILVWQDFIYSCSIYGLDQGDFLDNVRQETLDNVRRLRHRASLALWCGNNEMEQGWESWGWAKLENEDMLVSLLENIPSLRNFLGLLRHRGLHPEWETLRQAYETFFYETLPDWVDELDPDTPYWTSSPSSDSHFVDVNSVKVGDTHNWEVWHGNLPFEAYRDHPSRFVSEFGFQSLPAMDTIRTYADESDWNMTSYIMEHHQRNDAGNSKIIKYMTDHFRMPNDFESLVYLTQLLQAEAVRTGVEYWRRNMICTSGALYWQLNDCWPVASWASLDYYGRWKALHYLARRFYAPLLLSVQDEGRRMDVHVTSDLMELWGGVVHWSLETVGGEVLKSGHEAVIAAPLADTAVCRLDFSAEVTDSDQRQVIFVCELRHGEECLSRCVTPFETNKHLKIEDPGLSVDVTLEAGELIFTVSAVSLARFVELHWQGAEVVFSDNYFDLPAGRKLRVVAPLPAGWSLNQARAALTVRSLYDSY